MIFMVDSSYLWKFKTQKSFFFDVNESGKFRLDGMTGDDTSTPFNIWLIESVESVNYQNLINENGQIPTLDEDKRFVELKNGDYTKADIFLNCQATNDDGFTISIGSGDNPLNVSVGDETRPLQALFLVNKNNNYLMAYAILNNSIMVQGNLTFPFNGNLASVRKSV